MNTDKKLISWLRDAHAIEQHVEKALKAYAATTADFPALHRRFETHLAETRSHKDRLERCLKTLGWSHSGLESAVASILATGQAAAAALLGDAVLTQAAAAYALEHLQIATYTAIIAAAEKAGRFAVADTCREIMAEDAAMGSWLLDELPRATADYLEHQAA